MRAGLWGLLLTACVFIVGQATGLVQTHYLKTVENNALLAPIKIVSIDGPKLVLADGRILEIKVVGDTIKVGNEVDVEDQKSGEVVVFMNCRKFICGTSWARGLIQIPIFADRIDRNWRREVAWGNDVTKASH